MIFLWSLVAWLTVVSTGAAAFGVWSIIAGIEDGIRTVLFPHNIYSKNYHSGDVNRTVHFLLWTRQNPNDPQWIYLYNDESLAASNFDPSKPVRIFSHGWISTGLEINAAPIRVAYLEAGDYNVITIDWSAYSRLGLLATRSFIPKVAKRVSLMIDWLESKGASLDTMVVSGHSYGAHIAGLGSEGATNTVDTVVALDPAGIFYSSRETRIVSTKSARFVQIIHSDGGFLGYFSSLGHADYYPNGGTLQPGCIFGLEQFCDHVRVWYLFAESIKYPDHFIARSCNGYIPYMFGDCDGNALSWMGGDMVDKNARGSYYLQTNGAFPWGKGANV